MPAVSSSRVSTVVGYQLATANFNTSSPNLPQRVAILAEANTANQTGLSTLPVQITTARQAGQLYGFGSPIYNISRILFPSSGGGITVPVWVYPQAAAVSSTARVQTITVTGPATASGTHYIKVAGREMIDGSTYAVNIVSGDTATVIAGKIKDSINGVLGSPLSATSAAAVTTTTTKWTGLTAEDVQITMDTNGSTLGITYVIAETTAGSGTPDISAALTSFGNAWNTIVINSYGAVSAIMSSLENFNGIPSNTNPTGRYAGIIMKPFIALTGTTADDPTTITNARSNQVTLAFCPAPLSPGLPMEAAANMAVLFANNSQDSPHLDVSGQIYPDMPMPDAGTAIAMDDYNTRDAYVQKGCSTVTSSTGGYMVQDFVTTYNATGEVPPQFRYCRNLMIDYNVRYGYYLLEKTNVIGHAIAKDSDTVSAPNVVKPKIWKQVLSSYAEELAGRALISDKEFMQSSISVAISTSNPDRFETQFNYKRSGYLRIASTVAVAGFNFG